MRQNKGGKRLLAIALSAMLTISGAPAMAVAEGQNAKGICEHHQKHTIECGYAETQTCAYNCQEPHAGLSAHAIGAGNPASLGLTARVTSQRTYQIRLSPDNFEFSPVDEGYTVGVNGDVQPQTVNVYNEGGTSYETSLFATLEGTNADAFDINGSIGWEGGGYSSFTIAPRAGLSAGTYNATLNVQGTSTPAVTASVRFTVLSTASFVAVTGVADVPDTMTEGTSLALTGTVEPSNATNKNIVWSLENAGGTGAALSGDTLTAAAAGTVTVKATIADGKGTGIPYTQDFSITVNPAFSFVAVTNVTGVPDTMTEGTSLTLTGTVEPSNATNRDIVWSLESAGGTGAALSGDTLTAAAAGTVTVRATITDGKGTGIPYTQEFSITVNPASSFVAVTGITSVPDTMTAGTPLTLRGTVEPSNATNKNIVWSLENAGGTGAVLSGDTLSAASAGTVTVKATIVGGDVSGSPYAQTFSISVNAVAAFYQLTLEASEGGSIDTSVSVSGAYQAGTEIQIYAIPKNTYSFLNWESSNGGSFDDPELAYTFYTMPASDTVVTANFSSWFGEDLSLYRNKTNLENYVVASSSVVDRTKDASISRITFTYSEIFSNNGDGVKKDYSVHFDNPKAVKSGYNIKENIDKVKSIIANEDYAETSGIFSIATITVRTPAAAGKRYKTSTINAVDLIKVDSDDTVKIVFDGIQEIDSKLMKIISQQDDGSGAKLSVYADRVKNGEVIARFYIDPEAAGNLSKPINTGVQLSSTSKKVKAIASDIKKIYGKEAIDVIWFEQKGSYDKKITVAVKKNPDLIGGNLTYYKFDPIYKSEDEEFDINFKPGIEFDDHYLYDEVFDIEFKPEIKVDDHYIYLEIDAGGFYLICNEELETFRK